MVERHCGFNARSPGLALRKVQVRGAVFVERKSSFLRVRVRVIYFDDINVVFEKNVTVRLFMAANGHLGLWYCVACLVKTFH